MSIFDTFLNYRVFVETLPLILSGLATTLTLGIVCILVGFFVGIGLAMLRLYAALGFRGPIRVDHVPSLTGEEDLPHGYAYLGRLFALGYMKGILADARISFS